MNDDLKDFRVKKETSFEVNEPTGSLQPHDEVYPMGRARAWCTVAGSCLLQLCSIGVITSVGVFQEFYTDRWLNHFTPSQIGWIPGISLASSFAFGFIGGGLSDAGYCRLSLVGGSLLFSFSMFMLSLTHPNKYYQVFLSQAIGIGLGSSLMFTPTNIVVAHHFKSRKAIPLGILGASRNLGAFIYSIMLNQLIHGKVGFPWGIRTAAFLSTAGFFVGNILISVPALPSRATSGSTQSPQFSNYKEYLTLSFVLTLLGSGLISQVGFFFPLQYGQTFALRHKIPSKVAFYAVAINNISGLFGKILVNAMSGRCGPVNILITCQVCAGILLTTFLACGSLPGFITFTILYALFLESILSLYILTILAMAPSHLAGKALGISSIPVGISAIIANPVAGAIMGKSLIWWKGITWAVVCICIGATLQVAARYIHLKRIEKTTGQKLRKL